MTLADCCRDCCPCDPVFGAGLALLALGAAGLLLLWLVARRGK